MKKRLQRAGMSVEYTWRCVVCRAETVRVLRGDQAPPRTITCPRCYICNFMGCAFLPIPKLQKARLVRE